MFSRRHCCPVPPIHSLDRGRASTRTDTTALVHEAYFKLVDQGSVQWRNRSHLFGIAAQAMRRILVDRARASGAAKRGAREAAPLGTTEPEARQHPFDLDVLALDGALSRLETLEPRWARLVELRFCAGLSIEETAAVVGISPATVKRDWHLARAWRYRELRGEPTDDS